MFKKNKTNIVTKLTRILTGVCRSVFQAERDIQADRQIDRYTKTETA